MHGEHIPQGMGTNKMLAGEEGGCQGVHMDEDGRPTLHSVGVQRRRRNAIENTIFMHGQYQNKHKNVRDYKKNTDKTVAKTTSSLF